MNKTSIQRSDRFYIADKIKMDEYAEIVEHVARTICDLNIHGKRAVVYIAENYENEREICRGISKQKFISDVLILIKQKNH